MQTPDGLLTFKQLEDLTVILIRQGQETRRYLPDNVIDRTKRILHLCGYDFGIYMSKLGEEPHLKPLWAETGVRRLMTGKAEGKGRDGARQLPNKLLFYKRPLNLTVVRSGHAKCEMPRVNGV